MINLVASWNREWLGGDVRRLGLKLKHRIWNIWIIFILAANATQPLRTGTLPHCWICSICRWNVVNRICSILWCSIWWPVPVRFAWRWNLNKKHLKTLSKVSNKYLYTNNWLLSSNYYTYSPLPPTILCTFQPTCYWISWQIWMKTQIIY